MHRVPIFVWLSIMGGYYPVGTYIPVLYAYGYTIIIATHNVEHSEQRGGGHDQALAALVEEAALQAVLHSRRRVQLAVDGVHGTDSASTWPACNKVWCSLFGSRGFALTLVSFTGW